MSAEKRADRARAEYEATQRILRKREEKRP